MAKNSKTVRVTTAQKTAAKALVHRSARTGRYVSPAAAKIANAQPRSSSGEAGRYVTVSDRSSRTARESTDRLTD